MSTASVTTGISTAAERAVGIPYRSWCGSTVFAFTSKSDSNPYRRYYRYSHAAAKKLNDDNHVFKWVEAAFENEIVTLHDKIKQLEDIVKTMLAYMEDQESIARMKVEKEVCEKVEIFLEDAKCVMDDGKWRMKIGIFGGILGGIVVSVICVGIKKWLG